MAQMLAMVCNELHNLSDAEYAYRHSIGIAIGVAPNEVYTARLPHLPLDQSNGVYHSLDRKQIASCHFARECQQRAR